MTVYVHQMAHYLYCIRVIWCAAILALEEGKTLEIRISIKQASRSLAQNRLYWKWITLIANETGNDKEDMHEYFKKHYQEPDIHEVLGEIIAIRKSTTKLTVKEFTQYLNRIEVFAGAELSIVLPHPEDLYYQAMGQQVPR